ncbi:hypothetical protein JOM56_013119 [Amanita muscaria]
MNIHDAVLLIFLRMSLAGEVDHAWPAHRYVESHQSVVRRPFVAPDVDHDVCWIDSVAIAQMMELLAVLTPAPSVHGVDMYGQRQLHLCISCMGMLSAACVNKVRRTM